MDRVNSPRSASTFFAAQSVPEPPSPGLLALGACGGLILMVRRHRVGHVSARG
jgi:hypothetical protein